MAGRGGTQEWRHGWIPLTPAAALQKAKGSKTTAAKLRSKHGVKSGGKGPLTRDTVRGSRQTSIPDGRSSSAKRPAGDPSAIERLRSTSNAAAEKHNLPFRQGETVKVRSIQGTDLGVGKVHGISGDGKYADVIYGSSTTPRRVAVNYIKPANTTVTRGERDRAKALSDSELGSELTKSGSTRGRNGDALRAEKASRSVGRPADVPTPDTTVAASSRRAAIGKMSDAQLAELRQNASNGQTKRFAADEQAKRAAKTSDDSFGIPLPDGYKVRRATLSDGRPAGYELVDPDGRSKYAGTKASEVARAARVDLVQRQQRDTELAERSAAAAKIKADKDARDAENRRIGEASIKRSTPEELATHGQRQLMRDRNRYQRSANGGTQLTNEQLEGILKDPDATAVDKQRARADLEKQMQSDIGRRIAGVKDEDLPEALRRIEAAPSLSAREKTIARRLIAERTAGKSISPAEQSRARTAAEQADKAKQLREASAAQRAKLQGIADGAGVGRLGITDPQANRLSGRGLAQAHRNTDSSLRRYTETQQRANALEGKAIRAEGRAQEASRTRLTKADVEGATHIVDQYGQAREVVRVNAKTVTVKTPYSWTETVPIDKIRRAVKATPAQIAAARAKAAAKK